MSPKLYLWQYYNNNPDQLSDEELIDWYIKEFYELRLKHLNPYDLLNTLNQKFGDEIVLLCHELPGKTISKQTFCHRRLLADWIELEIGIIIPEISIDTNGVTKNIDIYDLKPKIKKIMRG